jgi:hypothetical protein
MSNDIRAEGIIIDKRVDTFEYERRYMLVIRDKDGNAEEIHTTIQPYYHQDAVVGNKVTMFYHGLLKGSTFQFERRVKCN